MQKKGWLPKENAAVLQQPFAAAPSFFEPAAVPDFCARRAFVPGRPFIHHAKGEMQMAKLALLLIHTVHGRPVSLHGPFQHR